MPARLRPTGPTAADAILVGDPGRALMLAQELTEEPKMSNHARGLWGYHGETAAGSTLTIQATGMGGPSAAIVLADLAELGVRRAIRIGTCTAFDPDLVPGELLIVSEASAAGGSGTSFGVAPGGPARPEPGLRAALSDALGENATAASVASLDHVPGPGEAPPPGAAAVDLQTVALLARGESLGIAVAAVLIVSATPDAPPLADEPLAAAAKRAAEAASAVLSA